MIGANGAAYGRGTCPCMAGRNTRSPSVGSVQGRGEPVVGQGSKRRTPDSRSRRRGTHAKLSEEQKRLITDFLWHGPEAYGFRGEVWMCPCASLTFWLANLA